MPDISKSKLKVLVLTADDSKKVFRMDNARIEAALERYPEVRQLAEFEICRTTTSYEDNPSWNSDDHEMFYSAVRDKDVILGYMFPLRHFGEYAPNVRYIHIIGAGVEHLFPLDWLPTHMRLANSSGAHAPKTCEYAQMAMLMLGNNMPRLMTAQREHRWDGHFVTLVSGKTALIVGCGKQGSAVAEAAARLGLRAIGVDPRVTEKPGFEKIVTPDKLTDVLPEADFVFLTVPASPETYHFFGEKEFGAMKPGAGFVNICRGSVLDSDALISALNSERISGAVLDVYEKEPLPPDSPLWSVKNIILSPHMGCDDEENYIARCLDIFCENLIRDAKGETLYNLIKA
jgi:phosphoglycerate dehydrogenase-like enzyme